ncbi:UMP-CMP kinase [Spizellomyces punctatus DAOM BR117]|uniref:Uridylate kinase n=1 Tax=Spizellomyces punctatus (strain DAOM BR117) TaxID=645134 RepID=A0A0L0HBR6_SPIPD|nr:UMP-CMP kinase [Spizellomyces punctatus DAOM BR117]KNC98319.1 UMP-CMP kinase [Spizellomyces punctatus DAOM BR117]|eukprot:XP_016606359.1 UMP-CMP kinase [Spizellomyces punctatus DAOM BR117]
MWRSLIRPSCRRARNPSLISTRTLAPQVCHASTSLPAHPDAPKGPHPKISGPALLIVALTGVGVAATWKTHVEQRQREEHQALQAAEEAAKKAAEKVAQVAKEEQSKLAQKAKEAKAKVIQATEKVVQSTQKAAQQAVEKTREEVVHVKETVVHKAQQATEATGKAVQKAKEQVSDAVKKVTHKAEAVVPAAAHKLPSAAASLSLSPLPDDTTVVFVLGGPGAGKGTQCANLVRDYGFVHLSAGDLLRAEQNRSGSEYGELINSYIKEGQIVPMEITIALLHKAMKEAHSSRFLVDGFPRKMDQALKFEEEVCEGKFILYFECPEEEMLKRLLKRGETSGRVDDNIESIKKRFQTFKDTSFPVIEHYEAKGKVKTVSCLKSVEDVYADTKKVIDELVG